MNELLTVLIISWFICQTVKLVLHLNSYHKLNLWVYLESGGMPSAHSTLLIALCTSLFYETGLSTLFLAAAIFSLLILSDAMKVRRQPGIQSDLMAKFVDVREVIRRKLTESMGHTPEQVFVGALIGFFIASIVYVL